jgi:hypothetical protein
MTDQAKTADLAPIATRVLYEDEQVRIWDQRLEPGEVLPAHRHEHDYMLCNIQGDIVEADFLPGSEGTHGGHVELPVARGSSYFIKKGGLETAHNNGKIAYRAILIEYKQD